MVSATDPLLESALKIYLTKWQTKDGTRGISIERGIKFLEQHCLSIAILSDIVYDLLSN